MKICLHHNNSTPNIYIALNLYRYIRSVLCLVIWSIYKKYEIHLQLKMLQVFS